MTAGKPQSLEEAHSMFETFMVNKLVAITGVHLIHIPTGKKDTFSVETSLLMRKHTKEERSIIFEKVSPLDKAGGFSIELCPDLFSDIHGSISNVQGLPMEELELRINKLIDN